jgi:hypothetical protein
MVCSLIRGVIIRLQNTTQTWYCLADTLGLSIIYSSSLDLLMVMQLRICSYSMIWDFFLNLVKENTETVFFSTWISLCTVITTVILKSSIFWDIMPLSQLKVNQRFWEHMSPPSSGSKRWLLAWLILRHRGCRQNAPPKRRLTFNGLHSDISQRAEIFIATAVRTLNHTTVILSKKKKKNSLGTFWGRAARTAQMNQVTTWDGTLQKFL